MDFMALLHLPAGKLTQGQHADAELTDEKE
jgi:hypothetical protein